MYPVQLDFHPSSTTVFCRVRPIQKSGISVNDNLILNTRENIKYFQFRKRVLHFSPGSGVQQLGSFQIPFFLDLRLPIHQSFLDFLTHPLPILFQFSELHTLVPTVCLHHYHSLTFLQSVDQLAAMVYSLTYRRPPHISSARASLNGDEKANSIGESTLDPRASQCSSIGIPEALSFDRIISGGTCPVSTYFLEDVLHHQHSESFLLTGEFLAAVHHPRLYELSHLHRALGRKSPILPLVP